MIKKFNFFKLINKHIHQKKRNKLKKSNLNKFKYLFFYHFNFI